MMQSGGQSATSWANFRASWNDEASNCLTGDGDLGLLGDPFDGDSMLFLILLTISLGGLLLRLGSISPVALYAGLPGNPFEIRILCDALSGLLNLWGLGVLWVTGVVVLVGGLFWILGGEESLVGRLHSHLMG